MTQDQLHDLDADGRRHAFAEGTPVAPADLSGHEYLGVSLGLPSFVDKIAWKTFIKAFHTDDSGIRGWNIRLVQNGLHGPFEPMISKGRPLTFGHFRVEKDGDGLLLNYGAGDQNSAFDPVRALRDPVVAISGDPTLLLGYSALAMGPFRLSTPSWFTLRRLRPLSHVPPRR